MRLPNIRMLLHWPSRMHIYGFVRNLTFFNIMVIAMVPSFRRGPYRKQSKAIVKEGMGPYDEKGKISSGRMSKQRA